MLSQWTLPTRRSAHRGSAIKPWRFPIHIEDVKVVGKDLRTVGAEITVEKKANFPKPRSGSVIGCFFGLSRAYGLVAEHRLLPNCCLPKIRTDTRIWSSLSGVWWVLIG